MNTNHLPVHPLTGARALGIVGGRPVWPMLGGDESPQNPVLARLLVQRGEQETFIRSLLERVESESRDMVTAERSNLEAARQRITELDEQIVPLEAFEQTLAAHRSAAPVARPSAPADQQRQQGGDRMTITPREVHYATPGAFLVDYVRTLQFPGEGSSPVGLTAPDPDAVQRVRAARAYQPTDADRVQARAAGDAYVGTTQTTGDTPPLLPVLQVGPILNNLDASRPFITSVGPKSLADRPGMTFYRPFITTHTSVAEQTAELQEIAVGELKMDSVAFTKRTFGGHVPISRQAIDWTDPSAWDAVVNDLQEVYGIQTEDTYSAAFAAGVVAGNTVTIPFAARGTIEGYVDALYTAAVQAATAKGTRRATAARFPDHIWTSLDQWASLGAMIAKWKLAHPGQDDAGSETRQSFSVASLLDLPRTMCPGMPAGTIVIGRAGLYEFYEQRIGLLQAVMPKVLGVDVAYGGYAAGNFLDTSAFAKVVTAAS